MTPWQFLWLGLQWIIVGFILVFVAGTALGVICHLLLNGIEMAETQQSDRMKP